MSKTTGVDRITTSQEKTEVSMAVIQNDIGYMKGKQEEVNKKLDFIMTTFVTKSEFQLVRTIVYGLVGLILVAFVTTLILNTGLRLR